MSKAVVVGLIFVCIACSGGFAKGPAEDPVTTYLGLSIPYPDSIPIHPYLLKRRMFGSHSMMIYFIVDKKGKVKKVDYPSDSGIFIEPLVKYLKKIKFSFTPGRDLDFPLKVPVEAIITGSGQMNAAVRLKFPVSPGIVSDPELLAEFFECNGVKPPQVVEIPPLFYRIVNPRNGPDYLIITARVFLDERGQLQEISYPIPGQDDGIHQVQVAIMNARFRPAEVKSRPTACDFLLTFRIFGNLKYPYSPIQPPDSTIKSPFTARYFMMQYYNAADIVAPALPRNHGSGLIQAAMLARGRTGIAEVFVRIDSAGMADRVLVVNAMPGIADKAEKAIRLVNWYPARDHRGIARPFAGRISIVFDDSMRIVYIPEWLKF